MFSKQETHSSNKLSIKVENKRGMGSGRTNSGGYEGARGARQAGGGCTPRGASRAGAPQPHLSLNQAYPLEHLSKCHCTTLLVTDQIETVLSGN